MNITNGINQLKVQNEREKLKNNSSQNIHDPQEIGGIPNAETITSRLMATMTKYLGEEEALETIAKMGQAKILTLMQSMSVLGEETAVKTIARMGKARAKAEAKVRANAEAKARANAEAKVRANAEAKARANTGAKPRANTEAVANAKPRANAEAEVITQSNNETPFLTAYEFENNYNHSMQEIYMKKIIKLNKFEDNFIRAKPQKGGKEPWNLPYAIYLANPAKTFIKNIYTANRKGYKYDTLMGLLDQASKLTPKPNQTLEHDDAYIYQLNIPKTEKVIFLGDHHGSFHAFFRNLLRWYVMGIIKDDLTLEKGYRIIFCGDIVDRGQYALDILIMIWQMMIKNNTNIDYKVIINRGNHENVHQWYDGLNREIKSKYGNESYEEIRYKLTNFFTYCPSAVLVNFENQYKIFACHGFYPFEIKDRSVLPLQLNFIDNYQVILSEGYTTDMIDIPTQIRWNDLNNMDNYIDLSGRGAGLKIPPEEVNKIPGINLFIRGHQDNNANTVLLTKPGEYFQGTPFGIIKPNDFFRRLSKKGTNSNVSILNAKLFESNEKVKFNTRRYEIKKELSAIPYKAITISTNSDKSRGLNFDSFVIFEFASNKRNFNSSIRQNIKNLLPS